MFSQTFPMPSLNPNHNGPIGGLTNMKFAKQLSIYALPTTLPMLFPLFISCGFNCFLDILPTITKIFNFNLFYFPSKATA